MSVAAPVHVVHLPAARSVGRALGIGLAATIALAVVEAVIGYVSGSLALVTDAGHLVVDSSGLALALVATVLARRPPDLKRTYGYARIEVLVVPVQVTLMLGLAIYVAYEAVTRFGDQPDIDAAPVLVTGAAGLVVNILVLRLVHAHGHSNLNARAAAYEVMADAFGSLGVILAAVVLLMTGWAAVDIVVSLAIAALLVPRSVALLRHAVRVLLEGVPPEIDTDAINADALTIPGVTGLHDLHVWSLAPSFVAMSAHVDLETMDGCGQPIGELSRLLRERYGIAHVTLQPETPATHESIECCSYPDAPAGDHAHGERTQIRR